MLLKLLMLFPASPTALSNNQVESSAKCSGKILTGFRFNLFAQALQFIGYVKHKLCCIHPILLVEENDSKIHYLSLLLTEDFN